MNRVKLVTEQFNLTKMEKIIPTPLKVEYNKNMEEIYQIFAKNLIKLRKDKKITQLELAETLKFSDKNISKWENGQSLPTTESMIELSKYFGVSIDFLLTDHSESEKPIKNTKKEFKNHIIILLLAILCAFLISTMSFALTPGYWSYSWMSFIYALPIASILSIVFIPIWFKKYPYLFIAISALVWTIILCFYLSFLVFLSENYWFLFLIGIPLQFAVVLWSRFSHYHH